MPIQQGKLSNRICPDGMTIEEWQVALREEAARESDFSIEHLDNNRIWGDYLVSHDDSCYKIAFRGVQSDRNYCSCLDFRTSGLGTCKHIEAVILKLKDEVPGYPWGDISYTAPYSAIYISYKGGRTVRFSAGISNYEEYEQLRKKYFTEENILPIDNYDKIDKICAEALAINSDFRCYEDVYDFIDGEMNEVRWRNVVQESFPTKTVTTTYALSSQSNRILTELYEMLHTGYGIIVSESTNALRKEVIAMIDFVIRHEEGPALIIASNLHTMDTWRALINRSPISNNEKVYFVSKEQFKISTRLPSGLFSFVYVEDADCLKDWNNIISKTIKKLSIKHLYMQLPTISKLTPVQFSSISQHISPFILAPFHRFIRDFRPAFPLSDTGENLPVIAKGFVFTRNTTKKLLWSDEQTINLGADKAETVDLFLRDAISILSDDDARDILISRIERMLGAHD